MTELLYLHDSYVREFTAVVVGVEGLDITLDVTAFYPSSGGQPCDTGIIHIIDGDASFRVVDVKKKDWQILHRTETDGLSPGDRVACGIDWMRRYTLMRMHTAAHILSAVFNRDGTLITGNQLNVDKSRVDFNMENLDREKINRYVDIANGIIARGIPVETEFMKREDAMKIPGVVKLAHALPPEIPELRIVKIGGIDAQADGGTHVKNTSEIGRIELIDAENKGKSNRRLYYRVI